ncbi:hypothetical protein JIG36_36540 [Actinoplanes sp. LDG1-06]|uniref:Uncharacterized protein n=1 Tax=Paractinoplanes ovalisporus TaxID=2810368 RepID=A0ABS2AMH5_9ACTN|nr:hypothetical protein [Actinoplanes ovalisporus]MBM2621024.1 hypothetical protein [Actinoplanes ovalisporus]
MVEEARLQLIEITHLAYGTMTCLVRCLDVAVHVGDAVWLTASAVDGPVVDGLTVATIWSYRDLPVVDHGMTARVTVTGAFHAREVKAIRAAAAGVPADQLYRLGLNLVAHRPPAT